MINGWHTNRNYLMDSCHAQAMLLQRTYIYTGWLEKTEKTYCLMTTRASKNLWIHLEWAGGHMSGEHHNTGQSMSGTHCATWQDRYVRKAWYYRTKYVWEAWDGQDYIYLERTILQDEACPGMILQDKTCPGMILQGEACPGMILQDGACPGTVLQDKIYLEALYHITTTWAMDLRLQRAMNPWRTRLQSRNSHYESHMSNDWTSLLHYWFK